MKNKIKKLWLNSDIIVAVGCTILLAVTVLPFLYVAQYIWPSVDDFELSLWTKLAYQETGSIWRLLEEAIEYVKYKYMGWQGAFSSIFLMALQPGVWGDEYYWIGVILILVSLLLGVFLLTYVCMVKYGKTSRTTWLILCTLPTWSWFLRVMYTEEAFYWWTGASYYTGFHAWAMLMIAVAMCVWKDWERYGKIRRGLLTLLGGIACFFVGGGNYVSALMLVLVLSGIALTAFYRQKGSKWVLSFWDFCTLAALLISVTAPGNTNHMNNDFQKDISVVEAIFIAIRDGLTDIRSWTNISVIMMFVFLLPFVWKLARGCSLKFRFPLLATVLSGGLYLAGYAPISYTFGGYPPGRMVNLFYWNYFWLLLFNVFYWVGWLQRKWESGSLQDKIEKMITVQNRWQPWYICVVGLLFLLSVCHIGVKNTNLYYIYGELSTGVYQKADEFIKERVDYLTAHQGEEVILEVLPYKSEITYFGDLYPDKEHIVNTTMAEYYGVKSISIVGEEEK